jgi:hypothetical protein
MNVYLTIPNGSGWVHKHVMFAAIKILQDPRHKVRMDAPTHAPYVNNLHMCVKDFLNGGEDYWLTMDDDNPPTGNPLDRIGEDLDIVGFPTPVWHSAVKGDRPYYFNALHRTKDGWVPHKHCQGLQQVDAIGSGCMLIARRVLVKLQDQQPFMRLWGRDGIVRVGCDYNFCDKAKAAGFSIWADYDRPCMHFNELNLLEVIQSFAELEHARTGCTAR